MALIEPFLQRKIVVLHQDETAFQAARAMCEHRIGCVMVADHEGHLVGIVTDRDLVCRAQARGPGTDPRLTEVMTKSLVTVDEFARIEAVVELMESYGIRRVPVIRRKPNGTERCIGLVSLDDLIASRTIDHVRLSRIVQSQIFRRRSAIAGHTEAVRAVARAASRDEESLRRFHRIIGEKTELPSDRIEPVTRAILTDLVQRLHYTAAAHLISHLPRGLQDSLVDLPSGPDRTITVRSVAFELAQRFGYEQNLVRVLLNKFWSALSELIPAPDINHLWAQLPEDFREVFTPVDLEAGGDNVAAGSLALYL